MSGWRREVKPGWLSLRPPASSLGPANDTARWNSEIRKTSALIRPNETDSPAIARLADLQERIAHNERRINTVLSDIKKISNNLLTQQDVETAMTTFDPIWESMPLRDQIRLVQVVIKQVDYDGESGRVTILGLPKNLWVKNA